MEPDPFREGAWAYHHYQSREDNPYPVNTVENTVWDHGYSNAKHGYIDEHGWIKDAED